MIRHTLIAILASVTLSAHTIATAQELRKDSGYVALAENGEMYWESYGQGTPVILVHGHTLDRRMWRRQIPVLAQHYRVITPDMRGYGRSSRLHENQHTTHLDDLLTLMDSLHIGKAHVVGLSMGGFITADMLCMHPERLLTCTMASGSLRSTKGPSAPFETEELARMDSVIRSNRQTGIEKWRCSWIDKLISGGGTKAESIREELSAIIYDWDAWHLVNREPRLYYASEAKSRLTELCPRLPVMFISGDKEHKKRSSMMKYLPNSRFEVIPDCGHMSNMEQPELFNSHLLRFLRGE